MKITKLTDGTFSVHTGTSTADGRDITSICRLDGNILRTVQQRTRGLIVFHTVSIKLGPVSLAAVTALEAGETYKSC